MKTFTEPRETKYYLIHNHSELKKLVRCCLSTGYCSFDFETNGKPIYNKDFKPTILSISYQPGSGYAIPLDHFETLNYVDSGWDWLKELRYFGEKVICNPKVVKLAWNAKFDNQINEKYGIYYRGTLIDGMLAKYILDELKPNGLKDMVRRYMPQYGNYEKQDAFDKIPWDKKPLEPLAKYGCQDTDYTFRLSIFFEKKLIDKGLYSTYRNLIMSASRVLTTVEENGLYLDRELNSRMLPEYKSKIDSAIKNIRELPLVRRFQKYYNNERIDKYLNDLEEEISNLKEDTATNKRKITSRENKIANIRAGIFTTNKEKSLTADINLNSNRDLPKLLYSKKGCNFTCTKYTEAGAPSTSEETLIELRLSVKSADNPKAIFLDNLLTLRGLQKMYTTYIEGWSEKVQDDNCLHGTFLIHGTDSGRLSSREPNLQQIPKTSVDPMIKKQLIARPGTLYLASDFSQAELRIMAHLSGDTTYLEAFKSGMDPHLAIACKKYSFDYNEAKKIMEDEYHPDHGLWKVRRKQAKQLAFGLIYGIGPGLLAEKLSDKKAGILVSKEEAKQQMDEYFEEHPALRTFKNKQERVLNRKGYLTSLFGRRRRLPQIYSDDREEVAYAIRLALNYPCQSAASDMCLFGSILIYYLMRQGKLPKMDSVCLVHDANYMNTLPKYINVWTLYTMWNIYRNPDTKKYFGFKIEDVDMDMDFNIGRSMAEELPFIPMYNYNKLLLPSFSVEEYLEQAKEYKDISIKDYPKYFAKEMKQLEEQFIYEKRKSL